MENPQTLQVPVTGIQRFCMHDGPGIRTTVFFKGCPLRCRWCHNPETQSAGKQMFYTVQRCIGCGGCAAVCSYGAHSFKDGMHVYERQRCTCCGRCAEICPSRALEPAEKLMSIEEIIAEVQKDIAFYGEDGGLTLSGGEPMAHPEAAVALLQKAKNLKINTAVETCGYFAESLIPELCNDADMLLWDFKDSDPVRHRQNTGVELEPILSNLRKADETGIKIRLRCIIINGVNYFGRDCQHIREIYKLKAELKHCVGVDLIPYHQMGDSKCARLDMEYWGGREYVPDKEELLRISRDNS